MLFPLSLASEGSCRIGGNLATNAGGTAVLAYGNARELTLGLEVVLADGQVWNGLRALRKDNSGYDLKNLFVGSEGTLGIITAAVLRLHPKPVSKATAFLGLASARAALDAFGPCATGSGPAHRLRIRAALPPGGGVAPPARRRAPAGRRPRRLRPRRGLLTRPGRRRGTGGAGGRADRIRPRRGCGPGAERGASRRPVAPARELSEMQGHEGGSIKHDVSVPGLPVAEFLERASSACEAALPGVRVCAFGHFGDGNIHFNLTQPVGAGRRPSSPSGRASTASSTTSSTPWTARSPPSTASG